MAKSMICRTCGGYAHRDTSLELFESEQKNLLQYIWRATKISIKLLENLPTRICSNCQAEVIFPHKFIKRFSNAQFFFNSNDYKEKLNLMKRLNKIDTKDENEFYQNEIEYKIEDTTDNIVDEDDDDDDDDDNDDDDNAGNDFDFDTLDPPLPILTTADIFKPSQKNRFGKAIKRQLYKCNKCNNVIIDRHNFIRHMQRHYNVRPFQCEFCNKCYCTNSELKRHKYVHEGKKPYACEYCDRAFVFKAQKEIHERLHSGEKPYICEVCGSRFHSGQSLRKHKQIHNGERPHICATCNKGFQRLFQLKKHYESVAHIKKISE